MVTWVIAEPVPVPLVALHMAPAWVAVLSLPLHHCHSSKCVPSAAKG